MIYTQPTGTFSDQDLDTLLAESKTIDDTTKKVVDQKIMSLDNMITNPTMNMGNILSKFQASHEDIEAMARMKEEGRQERDKEDEDTTQETKSCNYQVTRSYLFVIFESEYPEHWLLEGGMFEVYLKLK